MYKLDLAALLQMLQEFQQNAILHTEIESIPNARGRFQVQVSLFEGKVSSCLIRDRSGNTLLANSDALDWLQRLGTLNWTLTLQQSGPAAPAQNSPLLSPSVPRPSIPIPRRIAHVTQEQMSQWSRKHRAVFVLVDGRKSVEQIAGLLSLPVKEVEKVLRDLQSTRFVALD